MSESGTPLKKKKREIVWRGERKIHGYNTVQGPILTQVLTKRRGGEKLAKVTPGHLFHTACSGVVLYRWRLNRRRGGNEIPCPFFVARCVLAPWNSSWCVFLNPGIDVAVVLWPLVRPVSNEPRSFSTAGFQRDRHFPSDEIIVVVVFPSADSIITEKSRVVRVGWPSTAVILPTADNHLLLFLGLFFLLFLCVTGGIKLRTNWQQSVHTHTIDPK